MSDSDETEASIAVHKNAAEQFSSVTGANKETATSFLEACNWNLELAINMHVDSMECAEPVKVEDLAHTAQNPASSVENPTASSSQAPQGLEEGTPEVRAPIPSVRQVLVDDSYNHSYNFRARSNNQSVFDAFRDFRAEARWQEELQRDAESGQNNKYSKKRTLEDLFRPPLDLMYRGSLDTAREEGAKQNKWLLVNIQNVCEFACQVLNRDIWSNQAVKSIVSEHFIFWQVYHDSTEGQRYMQFYNVTNFPYVAILDPRTGEKMMSWTTIDQLTFCEMITKFLSDHPSPNGNTSSIAVSSTSTSSQTFRLADDTIETVDKNLYEESEEMQLKAAIEASLKDSQNSNHKVTHNEDSDELETFDSDPEDVPVASSDISLIGNMQSSVDEKDESPETWNKFIGTENSEKSSLVIRFPDGKREQVSFPGDSLLKALFFYISSKGYKMNEFDLVTNFPRRNLKDLCSSDTLIAAGLFPRETVFVQHKS